MIWSLKLPPLQCTIIICCSNQYWMSLKPWVSDQISCIQEILHIISTKSTLHHHHHLAFRNLQGKTWRAQSNLTKNADCHWMSTWFQDAEDMPRDIEHQRNKMYLRKVGLVTDHEIYKVGKVTSQKVRCPAHKCSLKLLKLSTLVFNL